MTVVQTDLEARGVPQRTELRCGDFELVLDPAFGARINCARYKGRDVLRPVLDEADPDPLQAASFPLVPFSNRVRDGVFAYDGETYRLAQNWRIERNAIHGEGWKQAWRIVRQSDTFCELAFSGTAWWPWTYDCRQFTEIGPDRMRQVLVVTNCGNTDMPAGLGFHPYFPRAAETRLEFQAKRVWPPLSVAPFRAQPIAGPFDFSHEKGFAPDHIDHCYQGWTGTARIRNSVPGLQIDIDTASAARHCVLYVPSGEPHFCLEPVTHLSGALNGAGGEASGLARLKPGESLSMAMQIRASLTG